MKKILKYILSFILMIFLLLSTLMGIATKTITNKDYIFEKLEEVDFYNKTEEIIKEAFKDNILQSGMDETVLENIFEKQKLRKDIDNVVNCIYENRKIEIETDTIKAKLTENINKYVQEKQLAITNQDELNIFINTIAKIYGNSITYSTEALQQISPITAKVVGFVQKRQPLVLIITIILAIIVIFVNNNKKEDIAKYLGISLFSSGIIFVIAKMYINYKINVEYISIIDDAVTNLLQIIINQILNYILYIGITMTIIGIICIIIKIINIKSDEIDKAKQKRKSKH